MSRTNLRGSGGASANPARGASRTKTNYDKYSQILKNEVVLDERGNVRGLIGVNMDVTDAVQR